MARTKQKHIDEVGKLQNALESPFHMKGLWHSKYFKNPNPITLELACGWGDYTLELARRHPERNFIGIDKKGDRLWHAAQKALAEELPNVAFCRTLINKLNQIFDQSEVDEIWITFPDPQPKPSKAKKRLTSANFLEIYQKILKPGATVHLKTDHQELFQYTQKVLQKRKHKTLAKLSDIHALIPAPENLQIKTFYEKKFIKAGKTIKYLKFSI